MLSNNFLTYHFRSEQSHDSTSGVIRTPSYFTTETLSYLLRRYNTRRQHLMHPTPKVSLNSPIRSKVHSLNFVGSTPTDVPDRIHRCTRPYSQRVITISGRICVTEESGKLNLRLTVKSYRSGLFLRRILSKKR